MSDHESSGKRFKILAIAAACHPEKGSEPGLGWHWVKELSAHHDLWVIVGEYLGNREAKGVTPPIRQLGCKESIGYDG